MSPMRALFFGCVFAVVCGATASILLLVALNGLARSARRFDRERLSAPSDRAPVKVASADQSRTPQIELPEMGGLVVADSGAS